MAAKAPDARWADSEIGRIFASRVRRPKSLLVAEVYLVAVGLLVGRLILGALLVPGFLASADNVPPFVANANLGVPLGVAALGLPLCLVPFAIAGTRRPGRVPWTWTHVAAAWLIIAFAEMPLVSPDFTAVILFMGALPAALIGSSLVQLRRIAGQPWDLKWSRRRRALTVLIALAVAAFWFVYLAWGVIGIRDLFVIPPGLYPGGR